MYEELYEPLPQTEPYLKRLGLDTVPAADKKNLDRLIYAHQLHVPFEDLDVCEFKRTASLSISSLYEKIVWKKRGWILLRTECSLCLPAHCLRV